MAFTRVVATVVGLAIFLVLAWNEGASEATSYSVASLQGRYVYHLDPATSFGGTVLGDAGGVAMALRQSVMRVGYIDWDGLGNVLNARAFTVTDDNSGDTIVIDYKWTGTYTVNPDGTGTLTATTATTTDSGCTPVQAPGKCATILTGTGAGLETYSLVVGKRYNTVSLAETDHVAAPTAIPTAVATAIPTTVPTASTTPVPTAIPTAVPTAIPTVVPTAIPAVGAKIFLNGEAVRQFRVTTPYFFTTGALRVPYRFQLSPATSFAAIAPGDPGGVAAAPRQDFMRVGFFAFNGLGNLNTSATLATSDDNTGSTIILNFNSIGTYTMNSDGTGTITLTPVVNDTSCTPVQPIIGTCAMFEPAPQTFAFALSKSTQKMFLISTNTATGAKIFLLGNAQAQ